MKQNVIFYCLHLNMKIGFFWNRSFLFHSAPFRFEMKQNALFKTFLKKGKIFFVKLFSEALNSFKPTHHVIYLFTESGLIFTSDIFIEVLS